MGYSTEGDEEPTLESQVDTDWIEQMRAVLNETRLGLVQQLLAADSGALSVEELSYRNPDLKDGTIDYHLRELADEGVVTKLKADDPVNDLPNTYWAVTETGVELLKPLGFYSEIAVLAEADTALDRTSRIKQIEGFDGRP